jgi:hypothetical protein
MLAIVEWSGKTSGNPAKNVTVLFKTAWGHVVAYLVEALCYKPEGRGIEFR